MQNINVYQILSYGVIGLGFLLAFLAYHLLRREQQREPRKEFLGAIYVFMVFSVALCILGFISELSNNKFKDQGSPLEVDKEFTIDINEIASNFEPYFKDDSTKKHFFSTIRQLINKREDLKRYKSYYAFKLFDMELEIPKYGKSISTSLKDESRRDVYKKIQEILQGIDFYQGAIDGDQTQTYNALVKFQEAINTQQKNTIFQPSAYGHFGYRTLEAIRSHYRMNEL